METIATRLKAIASRFLKGFPARATQVWAERRWHLLARGQRGPVGEVAPNPGSFDLARGL